ncbi:MAG: DUF1640 domain-containing protein [Actinobacteria bacterium]|nr:DUF1640 domain-containing protein [Actinomycetota bacterium]
METAQVWTVIGLLAATLLGMMTVFGGGLNALRNDLQRMNADLRSEMRSTNANLRSEIQEMKGDLRSEIQEMKGDLRSDMRDVRGDIRSLGDGLRGNTQQLAALTVKVGSLDTKVGVLEGQISAQGSVLGDAIYGLAEQFREHLRLHAS